MEGSYLLFVDEKAIDAWAEENIAFLIAGLIAFAVIFAVFKIRRGVHRLKDYMRRARELEGWILERGFERTYNAEYDEVVAKYPDIKLFQSGSNPRFGARFKGVYEGMAFDALSFSYSVTTSTGTNNSKGTRTASFQLFIVDLPFEMPSPLSIAPESTGDRFWDGLFHGNANGGDIDFESDAFSRSFEVKCDDRKLAFQVLSPIAMEMLLDHPGSVIDIHDKYLVLYMRTSAPRPSEIEDALDLLARLRASMPKFLGSSNDVGNPTANVEAAKVQEARRWLQPTAPLVKYTEHVDSSGSLMMYAAANMRVEQESSELLILSTRDRHREQRRSSLIVGTLITLLAAILAFAVGPLFLLGAFALWALLFILMGLNGEIRVDKVAREITVRQFWYARTKLESTIPFDEIRAFLFEQMDDGALVSLTLQLRSLRDDHLGIRPLLFHAHHDGVRESLNAIEHWLIRQEVAHQDETQDELGLTAHSAPLPKADEYYA